MEFRAPDIAKEQNTKAIKYLTENLDDPEAGRHVLEGIMKKLGGAVESYPDWHPILTIPQLSTEGHISSLSRSLHHSLSQQDAYEGIDHTVRFVRGFITCPYSEDTADQIMTAVNQLPGLHAYKAKGHLYSDKAYPVVVEADVVVSEADGTIRGRDALTWFTQKAIAEAPKAQVAETWWNIRELILGRPHGSRSSLFVNQHTGVHMRKILEALNNSGMYGPIKESSLGMLSKKKRGTISETLIRTAVTNWDKSSEQFNFELRGEICEAAVRDNWGDGGELSVRIEIGEDGLSISGFYYVENDRVQHLEPTGKRAVAEKFLN